MGSGATRLLSPWSSTDENMTNNSECSASEEGTFEAKLFSSSPFLRNFSESIRRGAGVGSGSCSAAVHFNKPAGLTCLSPEVLSRLQVVKHAAAAAAAGAGGGGAEHVANGPVAAGKSTTVDEAAGQLSPPLIGHDGRVQWQAVRIAAADGSEGAEQSIAEGARLAVACHAALKRNDSRYQRQHKCTLRSQPPSPLSQEETRQRWLAPAEWRWENLTTLELPFAEILPGVAERIRGAESSAEEIYVALCLCLTILERALYDVYRRAASRSDGSNGQESAAGGRNYGRGGFRGQGEAECVGDVGPVVPHVAPAMILRDLIATAEVRSALPEQMLALLRVLLLPMGFNIRNLVWHGFLAPLELPRELASLVLVLTLCFPGDSARGGAKSTDCAGEGVGPLPPPPPHPLLLPPPTADQQCTHREMPLWWALDSFDSRLACPQDLMSAVETLLSVRHGDELEALVRRSAFVLPGREDLALLGLQSLGYGRGGRGGRENGNGEFFLVALLPVLEHGLRCVFSCANDSPGHLFAHLRQYYSTLDGFGQRAKHQLLLDQEMSGHHPGGGRRNLLLAALGPGLSGCLLDLFMMSAGPNLRGKVAHGEIDLAGVFRSFEPPPFVSEAAAAADAATASSLPPSPPGHSVSASPGHEIRYVERDAGSLLGADTVKLTAAVFLVLCRRYYCPGGETFPRHAGERVSRDGGKFTGPATAVFSEAFVQALDAADALCSRWVPRFHPHELLEQDLRACLVEFDRLALVLERREVSVEVLPGGSLACISVEIIGAESCCCGDICPWSEAETRLNRSRLTRGARRGGDVEEQEIGKMKGGARGEGLQSAEEHVNIGGGGNGTAGRKGCTTSPVDPSPFVVNRVKVTDTVGRLVPLPTSASGSAPGKPPKKKHQESGVFPSLLRVKKALGLHARNLDVRCKRSAAARRSCRVAAPEATLGEAPTSTPVSAFAVHYRSDSRQHSGAAAPYHGLRGTAGNNVHAARSCPAARGGDIRISPETNVVTASPLPQIACLSGLCRACAKVARGLRDRLGELERLLVAGTARSAQRRAYASTLRVAPVLLAFLACAAAAVEAFVVEWDTASLPLLADGNAVVEGGRVAAPAAAAATGLSFLRRLAAVTGTLGLCVAPGTENSCARRGESCSDTAGSEAKARISGKKGFAQALAELGSFLETKAARQGFAGTN